MSHYAIIKDSQVVNVIVWDGETEWAPPDDHVHQQVPAGEFVGVGFTWDGIAFHAPVVPVVVIEPEEPQMIIGDADPLTYNAIGYTTVAVGPLTTGKKSAIDGKPGLWLVGDRIPGAEAYSITRVA